MAEQIREIAGYDRRLRNKWCRRARPLRRYTIFLTTYKLRLNDPSRVSRSPLSSALLGDSWRDFNSARPPVRAKYHSLALGTVRGLSSALTRSPVRIRFRFRSTETRGAMRCDRKTPRSNRRDRERRERCRSPSDGSVRSNRNSRGSPRSATFGRPIASMRAALRPSRSYLFSSG